MKLCRVDAWKFFIAILPKAANHAHHTRDVPTLWSRTGGRYEMDGMSTYIQHVFPEDDGHPHSGDVSTDHDTLYIPQCTCEPLVKMVDTMDGPGTGVQVIHNDMTCPF